MSDIFGSVVFGMLIMASLVSVSIFVQYKLEERGDQHTIVYKIFSPVLWVLISCFLGVMYTSWEEDECLARSRWKVKNGETIVLAGTVCSEWKKHGYF